MSRAIWSYDFSNNSYIPCLVVLLATSIWEDLLAQYSHRHLFLFQEAIQSLNYWFGHFVILICFPLNLLMQNLFILLWINLYNPVGVLGFWGLGLEVGIWALRLGFGPQDWDLGLKAGI